MKNSLKFMAGIVALSTLTAITSAGPITPGNLVVMRFGDGSAALGTAATAAFLDEYTTAGVLVQSIPISSAGAAALTVIGNSTTEGVLNLSQDGSRVVFAGYRADAGTAGPSAVGFLKAIGTVNLAGSVDTSIDVTGITGTTANRSATTVDGTSYYMGTSFGVRYVGTPGAGSTQVLIDNRNSRQVSLFDNVLYASNGSTGIASHLQHYGVLPVGATTATPVITQTTADVIHGFTMLDLSSSVAGPDTVYAMQTLGAPTVGLIKYSFDGTNWVSNGAIASGASNVLAVKNGSNVDVYVTTGTILRKLTDSSGYNGALAGTFTDIATAGTNTGFRGIAMFPAAAGANLTGTVALNDYTLGEDTKTLTVEIYSADGSTLLETFNNVAMDSSGNFSVAHSQAAGTYDVYVKADHWLRKLADDVALSPSGSAGSLALTNGDVDGDNEVGPGDFGALSSAFGSVDGDSNWDAMADLDGDGEVGPSDFGILSANFGEAGD